MLQVYSQRFWDQAFHWYVIKVIVSYTEAFIGKFKNKLHTIEKGHVIQ